MMCSIFLKRQKNGKTELILFIDNQFDKLRNNYEKLLHNSLNFLPVTAVFAIIILLSNYFLFATSQSELAPQEDQGIIVAQATTAANSSLAQTH